MKSAACVAEVDISIMEYETKRKRPFETSTCSRADGDHSVFLRQQQVLFPLGLECHRRPSIAEIDRSGGGCIFQI
jgi:hypothetical protein